MFSYEELAIKCKKALGGGESSTVCSAVSGGMDASHAVLCYKAAQLVILDILVGDFFWL